MKLLPPVVLLQEKVGSVTRQPYAVVSNGIGDLAAQPLLGPSIYWIQEVIAMRWCALKAFFKRTAVGCLQGIR